MRAYSRGGDSELTLVESEDTSKIAVWAPQQYDRAAPAIEITVERSFRKHMDQGLYLHSDRDVEKGLLVPPPVKMVY